jgi:hypothetical protein
MSSFCVLCFVFCNNTRADEPRDAWVANGRAVPKPDSFVSAFRKAFVSTKDRLDVSFDFDPANGRRGDRDSERRNLFIPMI